MRKSPLVLILVLILSLPTALQAAESMARPIRHQGFLVTDGGEPVSGERTLVFALYDEAFGVGIPLWREGHKQVTVDGGLFSVLLGSIEPLPLPLFTRVSSLWLETSIGEDTLSPRVLLTAVPYALQADSLGDVEAVGWQRRVGDMCPKQQAMSSISADGVPNCVAAPVGEQGPEGPEGPEGPAGELAAGSVTSTELADGAVTSAKLADGAVTTSKIAGDFALDINQLSGLLGQETGYVLPDVLSNTVDLEIEGVAVLSVVVVAGPGAETEIIESYWQNGRVRHLPGLSQETMFVFEYSGAAEAGLQALHDDYLLGPGFRTLRSMSMIVRDLQGDEVFRWNFFEFGLIAINPGSEGRQRYTFRQTVTPDNYLHIQMGGADFGNNTDGSGRADSNNPATDKRVEIDGINTGSYPAVEVDEVAHTITLTFDWVEGCCIHEWYRQVVAGVHSMKAMSIIEDAIPGDPSSEIGRRNYFESWPFKYQNFTGFGQDQKMKARIVISFDWAEDA